MQHRKPCQPPSPAPPPPRTCSQQAASPSSSCGEEGSSGWGAYVLQSALEVVEHDRWACGGVGCLKEGQRRRRNGEGRVLLKGQARQPLPYHVQGCTTSHQVCTAALPAFAGPLPLRTDSRQPGRAPGCLPATKCPPVPPLRLRAKRRRFSSGGATLNAMLRLAVDNFRRRSYLTI